MQPAYEARPSNGQNALLGIVAFGLLSLLFLFGVLGAILSAFTISIHAMINNLPSRLFALLVCAGLTGLCVRSYLASRKLLKEWQDGGGEARLAAQQAGQQAARDAADREMYAALEARGVRFLAPYPIRRAGTDLEVYVDSVLAQHLRPDEIVIDRAYGERDGGHWLVGATNQRIFFMNTNFIGLTPSKRCDRLEIIELSDVVQVRSNEAALYTHINFAKRDGSSPYVISISTVKVNTGFSNQTGFSRSYPQWAQATVEKLAQGASLRGGGAPAQAQAPAQAGPPRVTVRWPDGSLHPAVVLESRGDQCFCQFSDGRQQWIPASAVAPALAPCGAARRCFGLHRKIGRSEVRRMGLFSRCFWRATRTSLSFACAARKILVGQAPKPQARLKPLPLPSGLPRFRASCATPKWR